MAYDFAVVIDVTGDLNKELREKYDIDYIRGFITYPDGTEERAFLDWSDCKKIPDCTYEKFYAAVRKDPNGFKTAPAGVELFRREFEKYAQNGQGIIAFSISSAMSATYSFMETAKAQVLEKFPEAKIYIIDTLSATMGVGLLAIHAAIARKEGKTIEETAALVMENRSRLHQAGWLDDLRFVAKKGRMNNAKAYTGTLIGIKPIGELDLNGMTTIIGKVRGEKAGFNALLQYIEAVSENIKEQIVLIAQSDRMAQAERYKQLIEEKFSPAAVYICDVFPSNGINMGPGLMAAYFLGKTKSEGLEAEREVFRRIVDKK